MEKEVDMVHCTVMLKEPDIVVALVVVGVVVLQPVQTVD